MDGNLPTGADGPGQVAVAGPAIVEAEGLTRLFGHFLAVDAVSFSVAAGETLGLIGSNGAGKSTVLRMLTTLLPPSRGRARVAGCDTVRDATEARRHLGYVPQLLSADGALTAWENLLLSARLYDVPRQEVHPRMEHALAAMDLVAFAHTLVQGFSGGMIRRLEIAQSMLHHPAVLFLDEPTIGLDPVARHAVLDHIGQLRRRFGTTIIVTSHDMEEIERLCDRIAVLSHGRLVALDTPAALKARIGPQATLDDVFASLAGGEGAAASSYREVRAARRAAQLHG
jgi:ABC-2 type transport system ATP-binding protein